MTRIRSIALVLFLVFFVVVQVVVANALGLGRFLTRHDPPPTGVPARIGVAYAVQTSCMQPIELGDQWWAFPARSIEPPPYDPPFPFSIWAEMSEPYVVPGVLTLSTRTKAVFRADSDGSEFTMTPHRQTPNDGAGCL